MYTNVSLSRLPAQFKKLGTENYGLGYRERLLLKGGSFKQKYRYPKSPKDISFANMVNGLTFACKHCDPDYLITNDEALMRGLLHFRKILRAEESSLSDERLRLLNLLETSLAPDTNAYRRDVSVQMAEDAGFNTPEYVTAHNLIHLESSMAAYPRPFFVKLNFAAGGTGVYMVSEGTDVRQTIEKIRNSGYSISEDNPAIIQSLAEGSEVTISFAAWKGQLLGYTVVKPLETLFTNGPSSVIKNLYRPQLEKPLKALVQKLQFSGFGGLDAFETSQQELPNIIEVNLRSTHTVPCSSMLGNDLVSLFFAELQGNETTRQIVQHTQNEKVIALFPDEIMRDRNSPYLKSVPLDISWDDPALHTALVQLIYKYDKQK